MLNAREYALKYNCSIAQAIADRDWPDDRDACIRWFREAAGRGPTDDEIDIMSPNTQSQIDDEAAFWREP